MPGSYPVVVIGAGNAALCAALSAAETGAHVVVLERASKAERGGNTAFTGGGLRMVHHGVTDLEQLVPDLTEEEKAISDFGEYTENDFLDDLARLTEHRTDPDLAELIVRRSYDTYRWLGTKGVRYQILFGRQAHKIDGRFKFFGGLAVAAWGGGAEMSAAQFAAAEASGVDIRYDTQAIELMRGDGGVNGVRVRVGEQTEVISASAVVLACGGFSSNAEWRAKYLGPGWDLARVRGTRYNMGDGLKMAFEVGAAPAGHWSGAHAVSWDLNAPPFGDRRITTGFQKHSYMHGLMVNADGKRFLDEGADFRNYTYAKYGKRVLEQPQQFAWQVFDQKVTHLLREDYRIREVTKVTANTLEDLADKLDGVDRDAFLRTVAEFNAAVPDGPDFNPNILDGRATIGLDVPKSNWSLRIDEPPFEAFAVTCGVTFTFGGLRVNTAAEVVDADDQPIAGLFAAGEVVGGIFYFNYPAGSGLTSGAVLGRLAGANAAAASAAQA